MSTRAKPINSRAKGANGEREFCRLIFEHLGVELVRNLDQSRAGGHDLKSTGTDPVSTALDAFAIEVKRYAAITPAMLAGFWQQAERQAHRAARVPALAYREDRREWRVLLPLNAINGEVFEPWAGFEWTADVSAGAFACLIRERAGAATTISEMQS
jgi:Holliday junction resolvase